MFSRNGFSTNTMASILIILLMLNVDGVGISDPATHTCADQGMPVVKKSAACMTVDCQSYGLPGA